jgi:hypothetical protein
MIAILRTESLPINDDSDLSTQLRASENSIHLARLVRAHLPILDAGDSAYLARAAFVIVSGLWPYSNPNTTVAVVAAELGMPHAKDTFLFNLREGPRQPADRADRPRTSPTPTRDPASMTTSFGRQKFDHHRAKASRWSAEVRFAWRGLFCLARPHNGCSPCRLCRSAWSRFPMLKYRRPHPRRYPSHPYGWANLT